MPRIAFISMLQEKKKEDEDTPFGERIMDAQNGTLFAPSKRPNVQGTELRGNKRSTPSALKKTFSREHKHRPVEASSKKPVPVFREVIQGGRRHVRDPRFDSLSGSYTEAAFKKRYSFLYDEALPAERKELKQTLSKAKSSKKQEELKAELGRITQQLKTEEARRKRESRIQKVKSMHKEATKGKKYYLKKSELKKRELILKYQELKESGQLEKYMEKRRKRNAAKEHRYLPQRKDI